MLAYAAEQGRLQLTDYEDRLTKAYAATTYAELDQLRADLPGAPVNARRGGNTNPAPSTLLLALMSGFERRGRWNVPKKLTRRERELFEQLASTSKFDPRRGR